MSDTTLTLRRQIASADDLHSVVRTMKALAAANIGQYDQAVRALGDYTRTVELGLAACFRQAPPVGAEPRARRAPQRLGAIVFGSDQGLVGQFNDVVADYALRRLAELPGAAALWAVGERVYARLQDAGHEPVGLFGVPNSVAAITALVGEIQLDTEAHRERYGYARMYVFHNQPRSRAAYAPVGQRLLPLDARWQQRLRAIGWPGPNLPQVVDGAGALRALIREYLFISLFRACAESLASENGSRLAAMQRAEKNIGELKEQLTRTYHRQRQNAIDDELFDVIAGYELLTDGKRAQSNRSDEHGMTQPGPLQQPGSISS